MIMMIAAVAGEDKPGIDIACIEIPVEIGGRQPDPHVWITALEIMQFGNQPLEGDGHVDLDSQLVVGGLRPQGDGLGFDLIEGLAHHRVIRLPGRSEFGLSRLAREQRYANTLLQRLDLMAHGGAGYAQLFSGQPERAAPGGRLESGESA